MKPLKLSCAFVWGFFLFWTTPVGAFSTCQDLFVQTTSSLDQIVEYLNPSMQNPFKKNQLTDHRTVADYGEYNYATVGNQKIIELLEHHEYSKEKVIVFRVISLKTLSASYKNELFSMAQRSGALLTSMPSRTSFEIHLRIDALPFMVVLTTLYELIKISEPL